MRYTEEHDINLARNQAGVFFKMGDYKKICQALEALESIRAYDVPKDEAPPTLTELLDRAAAGKERLTLTYQNQMFLAAVPMDDFDLIEEFETSIDKKSVREALKEAEEKGTISSEQLDKELGW